MTPQPYLSENGIKIFDEILNFVKTKGIEEQIDSFQLSMLANAFDLHERASVVMNNSEGGFTQITKNEYSQIRAEFIVWQKTGDYINKNADKFGLNPPAREKIKGIASNKQAEKRPTLSVYK